MINEIIGTVLVIVGFTLLIYIFYKVRKIEKESKKRKEELVKAYSK